MINDITRIKSFLSIDT